MNTGEAAISVALLAEWRQAMTPHSILDVREADELAICGIDSALHIPMREVPARLAELPADAPLVVMCHHGMRSRQVVSFLRRSGRLNAVNLDGGIDAWAREIDPSVRLY
jgi:rhodanese-related sulfurtransferase